MYVSSKELSKKLVRLAKSIVALEFNTQEELEKYKKEHEVRKDTKLTVKKQEEKEPKEESLLKSKKPITTVKEFNLNNDDGFDEDQYCAFSSEFYDYYDIPHDDGADFVAIWIGEVGQDLGFPDCWNESNLRIRSDGKPSFVYDIKGICEDEEMDEVPEIFKESDEFKKFHKDNPGIKTDYDRGSFVCTNANGSVNEDATSELSEVYHKFNVGTKFIRNVDVNGKQANVLTSYGDGSVEVNCDDLYGDLPVHESPNGFKYISMKDRKQS